MLEKLLEGPYNSLFTPESSGIKPVRATSIYNITATNDPFSLVLAPQKIIVYKEIVFPAINLDSIPHQEIVQVIIKL